MTTPHDQSQYQVRFDWGQEGASTVAADVDVVVLVDVLSPATTPVISDLRAAVVTGDLRNRTAVAEWVLARQTEKNGRFIVAVIAAGEEREDGSIRFAVEDQLGAGAIIDALAVVGIDYCSPEAAAACASFIGLRQAIGHLVTASASGRELIEQGFAGHTESASLIDVSSVVPVLKEYSLP